MTDAKYSELPDAFVRNIQRRMPINMAPLPIFVGPAKGLATSDNGEKFLIEGARRLGTDDFPIDTLDIWRLCEEVLQLRDMLQENQ